MHEVSLNAAPVVHVGEAAVFGGNFGVVDERAFVANDVLNVAVVIASAFVDDRAA